jgi:1,4-dihydroxy-2-naphthoate octaprenyltransferase
MHVSFLAWISAARLRTLPLAMAGVGMGNLIHLGKSGFSGLIMLLSILTSIFLQVLSNFANDLGDSEHGADNEERKGPSRMVQSGRISKDSMKKAVLVFVLLSLATGLILLWLAFHNNIRGGIPLLLAGICSISAAWFYTNGSKPYGYMALGDVAVFIFFGMLAVLGSAWLQRQEFNLNFLLPAFSMGFWSTAVLNLNNMRDVKSDEKAGKKTIPLILGPKSSADYHVFLVVAGGVSLLVFGYQESALWTAGALPGFFIMLRTLAVVKSDQEVQTLDSLLKPQALGTFLAVLGMMVFRLIQLL